MCLAVPGQVISVGGGDPMSRTGRVNFGGITKEVCLAYVPDVRVNDYVIVHVGFALGIVDEEEAQQTLQDLTDLAVIRSIQVR